MEEEEKETEKKEVDEKNKAVEAGDEARTDRGQGSSRSGQTEALWSGTNKNRDVSTGPLARPFARSLAPLTLGKVKY